MHTSSWILVFYKTAKENKFYYYFFYLFIETSGRKNDETFTVPAITYTQKQGGFDKSNLFFRQNCSSQQNLLALVSLCFISLFILFFNYFMLGQKKNKKGEESYFLYTFCVLHLVRIFMNIAFVILGFVVRLLCYSLVIRQLKMLSHSRTYINICYADIKSLFHIPE